MSPNEKTQNSIPIIDISTPSKHVAQQVLDAASKHGFLYIKNDGVTIPPQDIDAMFTLSKDFFATPKDQKSAYAIHSPKAGGINRGWVSMQGESLDPSGQKQGDPKEAFNIAPPNPTLQPLPTPLQESSALISRFQANCHTLCTSILSLLGTALQIPDPEYFSMRHDQSRGPSGTIFRMLYYPKTLSHDTDGSEPGTTSVRAGAHSDYGSVTLLFRLPGQPGLELLTDSGWVPVPVNPDEENLVHPPILVNIGDLLCYWTKGMLKSTVHRVTFEGGEERYSMAYFCHPLDAARLDAVPSEVINGFGAKGDAELRSQRKRLGLSEEGGDEVITAKGHLERRLKVTYGI